MGLVDPLTAIIASFCFLGVLIFKRVNLGITLNAGALLLAVLVLDVSQAWNVFAKTTLSPLTASLVGASFGIMLLSSLYKETKVVNTLSESLSRIVKNSKLIVSMLPAVMGLLPVGGGALISAPLVENEAEKLGLNKDKKTYVNLWFRHTIFPVYPVSQPLILTALLTGLTITSLILRQIPVVVAMVTIGYLIGLWKTPKKAEIDASKTNLGSELKRVTITFLPILATIVSVVAFTVDVSIAAFIGVIVLLLIARPSFEVFKRPFRSWAIWGIALAAYGALFLRNVAVEIGISQVFGSLVASGSMGVVPLLILVPAFLGAITGSPPGGISLSVPILAGIVTFTPNSASLLYMSTYLGYVIAPTHLCLILTAEYFKCPLSKLFKYLLPSIIVSFAAAILVYFLI